MAKGKQIIFNEPTLPTYEESLHNGKIVLPDDQPDKAYMGRNGSWTHIAAGIFSPSNTLYVDPAGDDTDNNGTKALPFATIQKAIDTIADNGDNTITNPYLIDIAPGVYEENVALEDANLVSIVMWSRDTAKINPASGNALQSMANNSNLKRLQVWNIIFSDPIHIECDTDGVSMLANDCNFFNCVMSSDVTAKNVVVFDLIETKVNANIYIENITIGELSGGAGQGPFQLDVVWNDSNPKPSGLTQAYFIIERTLSLANTVNISTGAVLQLREGVRFSNPGGTVNIDGQLLAYSSWIWAGTINLPTGGTMISRGSFWNPSAVNNTGGTLTIETESECINYDNSTSGLLAINVREALDELAASSSGGGGYAYTDTVYVSKNYTGVSDGSHSSPYKTLQAAIDHFGQPTDADEYQQRILIDVLDQGIYTENLTIPHRAITIRGNGLTIDGNITRQISDEKEYGISSSTFRGCLTLEGQVDSRDNHQTTRKGIKVTGNYLCEVISGETGSTTHDTCFINTEFQGTVKSNDGTVGSPATGTEVFYATGCKFKGDIEGRNFYCQRWKDVQVACGEQLGATGNILVGYWVQGENIIFEAGDQWSGYQAINFTVNSSFETSMAHFIDSFFRQVNATVPSNTIKLDATTMKSWEENVTVIGSPIYELLDTSSGVSYDNTISGLTATNVKTAIDELASSGGGGGGTTYEPRRLYVESGATPVAGELYDTLDAAIAYITGLGGTEYGTKDKQWEIVMLTGDTSSAQLFPYLKIRASNAAVKKPVLSGTLTTQTITVTDETDTTNIELLSIPGLITIEGCEITNANFLGGVIDKDRLHAQVYQMSNTDSTLNQITIPGGDFTGTFVSGRKIQILTSSSQDGEYLVSSSTYSSPDTTVTLDPTTPLTADGETGMVYVLAYGPWELACVTFVDCVLAGGVYGSYSSSDNTAEPMIIWSNGCHFKGGSYFNIVPWEDYNNMDLKAPTSGIQDNALVTGGDYCGMYMINSIVPYNADINRCRAYDMTPTPESGSFWDVAQHGISFFTGAGPGLTLNRSTISLDGLEYSGTRNNGDFIKVYYSIIYTESVPGEGNLLSGLGPLIGGEASNLEDTIIMFRHSDFMGGNFTFYGNQVLVVKNFFALDVNANACNIVVNPATTAVPAYVGLDRSLFAGFFYTPGPSDEPESLTLDISNTSITNMVIISDYKSVSIINESDITCLGLEMDDGPTAMPSEARSLVIKNSKVEKISGVVYNTDFEFIGVDFISIPTSTASTFKIDNIYTSTIFEHGRHYITNCNFSNTILELYLSDAVFINDIRTSAYDLSDNSYGGSISIYGGKTGEEHRIFNVLCHYLLLSYAVLTSSTSHNSEYLINNVRCVGSDLLSSGNFVIELGDEDNSTGTKITRLSMYNINDATMEILGMGSSSSDIKLDDSYLANLYIHDWVPITDSHLAVSKSVFAGGGISIHNDNPTHDAIIRVNDIVLNNCICSGDIAVSGRGTWQGSIEISDCRPTGNIRVGPVFPHGSSFTMDNLDISITRNKDVQDILVYPDNLSSSVNHIGSITVDQNTGSGGNITIVGDLSHGAYYWKYTGNITCSNNMFPNAYLNLFNNVSDENMLYDGNITLSNNNLYTMTLMLYDLTDRTPSYSCLVRDNIVSDVMEVEVDVYSMSIARVENNMVGNHSGKESSVILGSQLDTHIRVIHGNIFGKCRLGTKYKSYHVINGVTTGPNGTFTISGDLESVFTTGKEFEVHDSGGNDAVYTVLSSTYGTDTVITVNETIPDSTADGYITIDSAKATHVVSNNIFNDVGMIRGSTCCGGSIELKENIFNGGLDYDTGKLDLLVIDYYENIVEGDILYKDEGFRFIPHVYSLMEITNIMVPSSGGPTLMTDDTNALQFWRFGGSTDENIWTNFTIPTNMLPNSLLELSLEYKRGSDDGGSSDVFDVDVATELLRQGLAITPWPGSPASISKSISEGTFDVINREDFAISESDAEPLNPPYPGSGPEMRINPGDKMRAKITRAGSTDTSTDSMDVLTVYLKYVARSGNIKE